MSARTRVMLSVIVIAVAMIAACEKDQRLYQASTLATGNDRFLAGGAAADSASAASFAVVSKRRLATNGRAGDGALKAVAAEMPSRLPAAAVAQTDLIIPEDIAPGSMLVRVGKASVQVESLETGISRVRDMARRTGAIIANTSMEDGKEQTRAASLELRIPSEHFDEAVNGLSPIGKLEAVNVDVQDVGEEFVDVQARMVNARRLEQRLIDLLANRTGKLTDVLRVEGELARVREEIERYEGRMRYLRSRSSVSTLTVAIHEAYPIVAEHAGSHPIRDAFAQAGRNFIGVTSGLIASLGVLIPIGVLVGAMLFIARRFLATHGLRLPEKASGRSERA
ncbi:MAG TPA: DUF4349 domain-containing protein [Gemmatimonadaceae bacterium]|nr:DUF4349 domain-containing protein [Gemmatimonadaceae bacterium]